MGESVPAAGRVPSPVGESGAGGQGGWVLGTQHPLRDGQQRGVLVTGPSRIPARPVQVARLARAVRVSGSSGPETRS
jgi:hypothetical protein